MAINVRERKQKLISEKIFKDPEALKGRRAVGLCTIVITLIRAALIIIDFIMLPIASTLKGEAVNPWVELIFIGLMLLLALVRDGNKAFASVPAISAVLFIFYYFSSVYPMLYSGALSVAYTVIYLSVMTLQFAFSVFMSVYKPCEKYFSEMRAVNYQIQKEIMGGRR